MKTAPCLTYERLTHAHAPGLYAGMADELANRYTLGKRPESLEELRATYARFEAGAPASTGQTWLNWAVRDAPTGELVGTVQATVLADEEIWIGYKIVPRAWGRGVGTASVQWLLRRLAEDYPGHAVLAGADVRNLASLRVLEKCGFVHLRTQPAQIRGEATCDHIYRYGGAALQNDPTDPDGINDPALES